MKAHLIYSMVAVGMLFASCANEEPAPNMKADEGIQPVTRALSSATFRKSPIAMVYIEVNDTNPLNAGSYKLSNGTSFFDIACIFAANIRGVNGQPVLYFNENVSAIMANPDKYIRPLQDKGIKVTMSILGDHTGLGVANMTNAQADNFAQQLADAVAQYGLDGIDFDDEYAEYGTRGYPGVNSTSYSRVITQLRDLMPADKLITVFDWGNTYTLSTEAIACIDFAWFGVFGDTSFGLPTFSIPLSRWSSQAINLRGYNNPQNLLTTSKRSKDDGRGAIEMYDLRSTNTVTALNAVARGAHGLGITYDGQSYSKDW